MNASPPRLDDLRRAIDEIDDGLLALLYRRFEVVAEVKQAKSAEAASTPLRPAREMQILKRLVAKAEKSLPPRLLVRLWRSIITEATLQQSPVTVHVSRKLAGAMAHRLLIDDYYSNFTVSECRDEAQALVQVNVAPTDIAIVETGGNWLEPFLEGKGGKAQVIATLPVLRDAASPALLVFGVAPGDATGGDETLLVSKGSLPRDFALRPVWQVKHGSYRLSALAGFQSERESPLVGLMRSNPGLGLKVAGRYPAAIII